MCGIVAIFSSQKPISINELALATQRLHHRGPDQQKCWVAPHGLIGLGHTRLSIVDLVTGDQPIANEDGQLHIIVNGEFYDFERIQCELKKKGHQFRTGSDSEILLHLYEEFGTQCLHYLRGEFAFILWDEAKQLLFAARDRFGIKPLFYTRINDTLYLASEAKALFAAGVPARWDHESFFQQLFVYVSQDRTLFEGVHQIPPGHYLLATRHNTQLQRYWDLDYPLKEDALAAKLTDAEYIEQFQHTLEEAVKMRLKADVSVGCFLSGGVDSSTMLGMAAKYSSEPIRAFTVTFDHPAYDEGAIAQETAKHTGAYFQPIPLNASDFTDHIGNATWHAETLDVNPRGVARYLQSRMVHDSGYKVVLSGEGSDEILAGYGDVRQDFQINHQAKSLNKTPAFLGKLQQTLGFTPYWLQKIAVTRAFFHILLAPDYAAKFSEWDVYDVFLNQFDIEGQLAGREPIIQSMYLWCKSILQNYVLFTDRLEMAHGVEVRLPFLDHHVFELVRHMPVSLLMHGVREKYVLREAARPFLLDQVYLRPKNSFAAPPATLTTNNRLYTLIQDSLRSSIMASVPFFDHAAILALLDKLSTMTERQRIALESTLMMLLSIYFLQERYSL